MIDDAGSGAGTAAYRGFLFSDVRGFTAYAERHGNTAAADMVRRFLDLARKVIAQHDGAEIKTEGDNIFAVFPSASSAVMCGLELVDAAADVNARDQDSPLELGVGVHAGEAVETAEGYIGSAVNMAARLCAAARAGEVLVSDTVKDMTQASIPVGFIARGHRRLKGFANAVETFAVTRDTTARAAVVMPRLGALLGFLGALGVAAVAVVILGGTLLPGIPGIVPPPPTVAPTPQPIAVGPLAIGTYGTRDFVPHFTFDITSTGWSASGETEALVGLVRDGELKGQLDIARIDEVIENPCNRAGDAESTGPTPTDVIALLQALPHMTVTEVTPVEIAGRLSRQADVTVAESALAACGGVAGADVGVFGIGGQTWGTAGGERFRLLSMTVGDDPVTILISLDWTEAHSVQQLEDMIEFGQAVTNSLRFTIRTPGASPART